MAKELNPRQVKSALFDGQTVENPGGWLMRINDNDDVEIWPPEGDGFATHIGRLDEEVRRFCKEADMPIPGVNETQGPSQSLPSPAEVLEKDTSTKEYPKYNPTVNETPKGTDSKGTSTSNPRLGPDTSDRNPRNFDPAINKRPRQDEGRGGLPDTSLGKDTGGADTNWGDRRMRNEKDARRRAESGIHWSELEVYDDESNYIGTLGDLVENAPENLDNVVIENGKISEWSDYFIAAPGENPDWDTPKGPVDWTSFENRLRSYPGKGSRRRAEDGGKDPFKVKVQEEPGKNLNKGETPSDPSKVIDQEKGEGKDLRDEKEGRRRAMDEEEVARGMQEKGYNYILLIPGIEPLYTKTMQHAAELMRTDYKDVSGIQPMLISKFLGEEREGSKIVDSFDSPPDASHIYREMKRARPSEQLLRDIMDPDKWAANNVFLPTEKTQRHARRAMDEAGGNTEAKVPKKWEKTVKEMKGDPEIDNPWALANWMEGEGYTPGGKDKKKKSELIASILRGDLDVTDDFIKIASRLVAEVDEFKLDDLKDFAWMLVGNGDLKPGAINWKVAGPKLREKWSPEGGYGRDIEAESAEELHALTMAFGGEEVDWSPFRPAQPEEGSEPTGSGEVEGQAPMEQAPAVQARKQAAFMEPFVEHGEWVEVDGPMGGESVSAEYVDGEEIEELKREIEKDGRASVEGTSLRDYLENSEIHDIELRQGYGAYMSAPGYMDRTDLSVFDTEEDALDYLFEMYMTDGADELLEEYEEYREEYEEYVKRQGWDKESRQAAAGCPSSKKEESAGGEMEASEITHRYDKDLGRMVQIVSPERLRRILDEEGSDYDPPSDFGPEDEWEVRENNKVGRYGNSAGGEMEAVDESAKEYWQGYAGEYGKQLTEDGDVTKPKPEKKLPKGKGEGKMRGKGKGPMGIPKGLKGKAGRKKRREAWIRAKREAQAAAPMAQPAAPAPAPTAPAPGPAPAAPPAAPGAPKAPGATGAPKAPGMSPGTGDEGLQALGWTPEDISLMDDEDKKKVLEIKLNKPGTKKKGPEKQMPGAPKAPGPAPATPGPSAPGPGVPAPAAPTGPAVSPPVAKRMALLIQKKIDKRRAQMAPAAPAAPETPALTQPAAPMPEFGEGMPKEMPAEQQAFQILAEVQSMPVNATSPEQVTTQKVAELSRRLLLELGLNLSDARKLFGLPQNKSMSALFE